MIFPTLFLRRVAAPFSAVALGLAAPHAVPATASPAEAPAAVALDAATLRDLETLNDDSNWVGLEGLASRLLAGVEERAHTPEELATALTWLAVAKQGDGHYADAEPLFRQGLALREQAEGPRDSRTAESLRKLAWLYDYEGRYADAEPLARRALAIDETALGGQDLETAASLDYLGAILNEEARFAEAEPMLRRALAIRQKRLPADHPRVGESLNDLGQLLGDTGRWAEAEPLIRQALAVYEAAQGSDSPTSAVLLTHLAALVIRQGRYAEAEPLLRRALAIDVKVLGADHPETAYGLGNVATVLARQGRPEEAEPLMRQAVAIDEARLGPGDRVTGQKLSDLGWLLTGEGRYVEAEPILRRSLTIRETAFGRDHPNTAKDLRYLASSLSGEKRYGDAEALLDRAVSIDVAALGPGHPDALRAGEDLGEARRALSRPGDAVTELRPVCVAEAARTGAQGAGGGGGGPREAANRCARTLSLALWDWSAAGGGKRAPDRPDALLSEAFLSAQRSLQSAAGEALARSAALTAAEAAGVGPTARAYEAALAERDALHQAYGRAAGEGGEAAATRRRNLGQALDATTATIARLSEALSAKAPLYWDYRAPDAVGVSALQAASGADQTLLRPGEALILMMIPPGEERGLVFAVTRTRVAWARIGLDGDAIGARVKTLRTQIDPRGYGGQEGDDPAASKLYRRFDRRAAYELYAALLGDPSIQAVIADAPTLLIVPSGPMLSLPPGVLVTAPPQGSDAGYARPEVLRATPWLLRSKALAVLPAVSSLRTLRQLSKSSASAASDPLLAFADPDFGGGAADLASGPRSFTLYFKDGAVIGDALKYLPSLPGTRLEAQALEEALAAPPRSVLIGTQATKAALMARNADGRLAKVRVLEFATHGLVAGDISGLAEPSLAMAAGDRPADTLLLASEASTLRLNADWVLLSACNTASPDAPEAQGLSGLSRAFFFAGARSLVVSHWRVRDDVGARLIPSMLLAQRKDPTISKAEALRRASLEILDDPAPRNAFPFSWAPFVLIGEPDR